MVQLVFAQRANVYGIFTVTICMTLTLTFTIGQRQWQLYQSAASYFLTIVMFALPVTVYKTLTFNLSKWFIFESMTFRV